VNGGLSPLTATVTVTPSIGGCDGPSKTFTITVNPVLQLNQPLPQTVNNGDEVSEITFGTSNTGITPTYSWTNDTPSIGLSSSGTGSIGAFTGLNLTNSPITATITVTPSIGGCIGPSKTFTITILPLPMNLSLQVNTVPLCEEGGQETTVQLQLTGGLPPYQITWSRGVPSPDGRVLVTRESGLFDLEVKDALGLVEKRSFTLAPRLTGPLDFSYLFASQAEFQGDLVGFDVNFSPQATWPFTVISWEFGDGSSSAVLNPSHRYAKKGSYLVTLMVLDDSGCLIKASQEIQVLDYFIEIPNVFTPNGDELNDTFFPKFRFIRNLQLQVMNKWGELIYRSHSQEDPGWDGLVSGQKAPEGVYVYKLRYQVPDGRTITSSSTFLLAR
jgi:gliding motility-associated-like protein